MNKEKLNVKEGDKVALFSYNGEFLNVGKVAKPGWRSNGSRITVDSWTRWGFYRHRSFSLFGKAYNASGCYILPATPEQIAQAEAMHQQDRADVEARDSEEKRWRDSEGATLLQALNDTIPQYGGWEADRDFFNRVGAEKIKQAIELLKEK